MSNEKFPIQSLARVD
ncbi:hypothetical protein JL09_g6644 [Pichia kudriavzevii]|uniref:Uncharacterized protein n=1 Tax=Pichia kudriavzevii TaxID=4909 RepID=A0A099NJL1_PICKU|nr:hypothetical protein JL09_g6644 [Pichia kudriavzevii]